MIDITKELKSLLLGIVLTIVGIVIFLMNVTVASYSIMYHWGRINVGGILIVLMLISFVVLMSRRDDLSLYVFIGLLAVFIISIILALDFRIKRMSAFELLLILGTIGVGLGLVVRVLFKGNKSK